MDQPGPGRPGPDKNSVTLRASRQGSIYRTLITLFGVLVFLPLVGLFVVVALAGQQQISRQLQGQLESVTTLQRGQIDQWIADRELTMKVIAVQPDVVENARALLIALPRTETAARARRNLSVRLNSVHTADAEFFSFLLVDVTNSEVLFATDRRYEGLYLHEKAFFLRGRYRPYIQLPGYDSAEPLIRAEPFMTLSRPIIDVDGTSHRGVLIGLVDISRLEQLVSSVQGLEQGAVHVFDASGRLVMSSDPRAREHLAMGTPIEHAVVQSVIANPASPFAGSYTSFVGEEVYGRGLWYTYANDDPSLAAPDRGLALFVEQPERVAFQTMPILRAALRALGVAALIDAVAGRYGAVSSFDLVLAALIVLGLAVTSTAAYVSTRWIVRPLETLTESAVSIAAGNLQQTVVLRRHDELGVLAEAFNAMTAELRELYGGLEQKVAERTEELEAANAQIIRRALQLQTSAEVAQAATSILDVDELLDRVVHLVRERFGFYHVQVFLLDITGQYAILRASTGEVGRELLSRHHSLAVGSHSLVGYVTARRGAHVAMDVADDPFHRHNPLLPETRAELAVPLVVGDRLLGALDVQSVDVNAFNPDDIALFESLAAQIAVAIENARLYQEAQRLARRERILNEFTAKIRGSVDVDQILATATRELARALGVSRAVVHVGPLAVPAAERTAGDETGAAEASPGDGA
jgi:putative methionine-R-sulfoxide reductase with GAF domain